MEKEYLPSSNQTLTVKAGNADNAHRRPEKSFDLATILSNAETRKVRNDYAIEYQVQRYQIESKSICGGLRGSAVRV